MEEFLPKFTSGTRYDGFKLDVKCLHFTKKGLEHCPKKFALLYDKKNHLIKLEYKEGAHVLPKNGRYQIDFSGLPMPRGRYVHQGDEMYKLTNN